MTIAHCVEKVARYKIMSKRAWDRFFVGDPVICRCFMPLVFEGMSGRDRKGKETRPGAQSADLEEMA